MNSYLEPALAEIKANVGIWDRYNLLATIHWAILLATHVSKQPLAMVKWTANALFLAPLYKAWENYGALPWQLVNWNGGSDWLPVNM